MTTIFWQQRKILLCNLPYLTATFYNLLILPSAFKTEQSVHTTLIWHDMNIHFDRPLLRDLQFIDLGWVVQSWVKPKASARFEFRFESLKSISVLILFVYKLMIGSSKNNRENYPRKCFWAQEKETRVKFNPMLSANQPSNNWALVTT